MLKQFGPVQGSWREADTDEFFSTGRSSLSGGAVVVHAEEEGEDEFDDEEDDDEDDDDEDDDDEIDEPETSQDDDFDADPLKTKDVDGANGTA